MKRSSPKVKNKLFPTLKAKKQYKRNVVSKYKKKHRAKLSYAARLLEADRKFRASREVLKYLPYTKEQTVKAPKVMSFINNTENVIYFINQLRGRFRRGRRTFVDLSAVTQLEHDALVILLSIMIRFKAKGIDFDGNFPEKESVSKILKTSGYLNSLYNKKQIETDQYSVTRSLIQLKGNRQVNSKQSSKLILDAAKTIWREQRRCQGVQTAIIELMQNTNNHANPEKPGDQHCWISTKHYPEENRVSFTLLDFGLGVFETLKDKPLGNKFFNWNELFQAKHEYSNNAELLQLILIGELHRTVTGHYFRGKGLPVLYELLKRNQISNLIIVTNDVRADVKNEQYSVMQNSFNGTFVSWELGIANHSSPLFID